MAWVMIDDLTGEQVPRDGAHSLVLSLDGGAVADWDVASTDTAELLAQLGALLSDATVPGVLPDVPHLLAAAKSNAESAPNRFVHDAEPDTAPAAEPDTARATDAEVRAWAVKHKVPASSAGALARWVREAYERVGGGQPDEQAIFDGARRTPRVTDLPAIAPTAPAPVRPAPPAVAVGDGDRAGRARPEQRDEAERLLEQGMTPRVVVDRTDLDLADVRELMRKMAGPR